MPLYWGAPDIGDFFNMDGVICFDDADDLRRKLGALTPDTYGVMRPAVEDNYRRAMEWVPIWQRLEDEITAGIKRKKGPMKSLICVLSHVKWAKGGENQAARETWLAGGMPEGP